MHRLATLFLALVICLATSAQLRVHFTHSLAFEMILCSAEGAEVVYLDPAGNPLEDTGHDCGACLTAQPLALALAAPSGPAATRIARLDGVPHQTLPQRNPALAAAKARAPPLLA